MHSELFSERDLTTTMITTRTVAAGKGRSEKMISINEGRLHSCALLGIPTTLSWEKKIRLGEMGSKYPLCSGKSVFRKILALRNL